MSYRHEKRYCFKPVVVFLAFMMFCGCYPLRKKFTRKKKTSQETVYVDFKEYSQAPVIELYNDYYLFINGWLDESIVDLRNSRNYKRQKRALGQALYNMELLTSLFSDKGKAKIEPLRKELESLKEEITPGLTQVEANTILRRTELLKLRFNKGFTYSKALEWMKK